MGSNEVYLYPYKYCTQYGYKCIKKYLVIDYRTVVRYCTSTVLYSYCIFRKNIKHNKELSKSSTGHKDSFLARTLQVHGHTPPRLLIRDMATAARKPAVEYGARSDTSTRDGQSSIDVVGEATSRGDSFDVRAPRFSTRILFGLTVFPLAFIAVGWSGKFGYGLGQATEAYCSLSDFHADNLISTPTPITYGPQAMTRLQGSFGHGTPAMMTNTNHEFINFVCGPTLNHFLSTRRFDFKGACRMTSLPEGEEAPFGAGKKVLIIGTSYTMQLGNTLASFYKGQLTKTMGGHGKPEFNSNADCKCLGGVLSVAECRKLGKQLFVTADFTAGDGYEKNMKGVPSRAVEFQFKNGARLMVITNHYLQVEPVFGVESAAALFGTRVADLDVVLVQEGHSAIMWEQFCDGTPGFTNISREFKQFGETRVRNGIRDTMISIEGAFEQLKHAGFKGQLLAVPADLDPVEPWRWSTRLLFEVRKMGKPEQAPFEVKVIPQAKEYKKNVPFVFNDGVCFCDLGLGPGAKPPPGIKRCPLDDAGECVFHPCEPGMVDIQANIMLHAINTPKASWG